MKVTIVDDTVVQQGEQRTKYGKAVLMDLSIRLTDKCGEEWSVETLDKCRKFYRVFSRSGISSTMQTNLKIVNSVDEFDKRTELQIDNHWLSNDSLPTETLGRTPQFTLSWSHYLILMRIENPDARSFYEIECAQQQRSVRQLSRQVEQSY